MKRYDNELLEILAAPNMDDEHSTVERLAKECLHLRGVIRDLHVLGTTSEDANEVLMTTIDRLGEERAAWGEDPDKDWLLKEAEDERRDNEAREVADRAKLAELKAKYDD